MSYVENVLSVRATRREIIFINDKLTELIAGRMVIIA